MSIIASLLCAMSLCSGGTMHHTNQAIDSLRGRSQVLGKEMLMGAEYGARWLIAHPWYTGELPMTGTDSVPDYPMNAGDHWTPPAGMRMAIGSAGIGSPFYVWMEPPPSTNFRGLGSSPDSLYTALDALYGHGLGTQTFRIGFARSGQLQEPARGVNDPLPDVLSTPVGAESVMLGGRDTACSTEPKAGDPALALPGTDAPATRCHRDAWKETTACTLDHYEYVANGSGGYTPIAVYNKTELIQGWNINQVFTPTYAQLVDPVAYPAGTTQPPVPPSWAPQTNPSTFWTTDCATNAAGPTDATRTPTAAATTEYSYGSCPAGYTGQITYIRVHTHYWQVDANPADVYSAWTRSTDTCAVAPGTTINASNGQQCVPGQWYPEYEYTDCGGNGGGGGCWQFNGNYWWSGDYAAWTQYHNWGGLGGGGNIPWVSNTCPMGASLLTAGTSLDGGGGGGATGGGSYVSVADNSAAGYHTVQGNMTTPNAIAGSMADTSMGSSLAAQHTLSGGGGGGGFGGGGSDSHNNGMGGTDGGGLGPV